MTFLEEKNFISILQRLKESMNVRTQAAIADKLGLTAAQISDVKRAAEGKPRPGGSRQIPLRPILEWALANEVDIRWLFTGEEQERSGEKIDTAEVNRLRGDLSNTLTRIETLTNQLNEATREGISHARRVLELEQENARLKAHQPAHGLGLEEMADVDDIHRALGLSGPVDVSQVLHAAATSFRAVTRETRQSIDDEADAEIKREGGQGGKAVKRRRARSSG